MIIPGTHDAVYQISLICHQKQSFGFFIKTADWVNPHGIVQIICHGRFLPLLFCAAYNSAGFIKQEQYTAFLLSCLNAVHIYFRIR